MTILTDSTITLTDLPIIYWDSIVTTTNVSAEDDPNYPATNVANGSTSLKWKHDSTDSPESTIEYFRIDASAANSINYVAIFGHNFGSAAIQVGLEIATYNSPVGDAEAIFNPATVADDSPLIFMFRDIAAEDVRIVMVTGTSPAEMTVVYAGDYTILDEGIQADYAPLPLAVQSRTVTGRSEDGQFLGRIVLSSELHSEATFSNMEQDFVRDEIVPFLEFAIDNPFFFAWSPSTYPDEVAFAWLESDPVPTQDIDGFMTVTLEMGGLSQ